jgi:hypothetical protein
MTPYAPMPSASDAGNVTIMPLDPIIPDRRHRRRNLIKDTSCYLKDVRRVTPSAVARPRSGSKLAADVLRAVAIVAA